MQPENPLLLPRMIWQVALVVTLVLVVIRFVLYIRSRKRLKIDLETDTKDRQTAPYRGDSDA